MPGFKFSQKNDIFFCAKFTVLFLFFLFFYCLYLKPTWSRLNSICFLSLNCVFLLVYNYCTFCFFLFFCFFLSVSVVAAVAQWVEPIYSTLNRVSWPVPYNNNVFPSSVSVMRKLRDWSSYSVMSLIWPSKREDSGRISISWWCPVTVGGNKAWKPAFCFNWHGSSCWALMSLVALTKIINAY